MATRERPEAVIVKRERLGDGAWALTLRIDDGSDWESLDPAERAARETVHTFYADHAAMNGGTLDPERWLTGRKAHVVARHLALAALDARVAALT